MSAIMEDRSHAQSLSLTLAALNRSIEVSPPAYLSVFRLLEVSSDHYVRDPGDSPDRLLVGALSCMLRVGPAKGPVRRRCVALLNAISGEADPTIILSLCRDLKELLYDKGRASLLVEDRFVVVTGLGTLMPKCVVDSDEAVSWLQVILDKKNARTSELRSVAASAAAMVLKHNRLPDERVADRVTSFITSSASQCGAAAAYLAYEAASSCQFSSLQKSQLISVCVKGILQAERVHDVQLWAVALVQLETPLGGELVKCLTRRSFSVKKSKSSASKSKAYKRMFAVDSTFSRFLEVLDLLDKELREGRGDFLLMVDMTGTALKSVLTKDQMVQTMMKQIDFLNENTSSVQMRALQVAIISSFVEYLGLDVFRTNFLEADLVSVALKETRSEFDMGRLSAASLLVAVFREQVEKRNGLLLSVLDDLKLGFIEDSPDPYTVAGAAATICLLLESCDEGSVPGSTLMRISDCAVGCIASAQDRTATHSDSTLEIRRSCWTVLTVIGKLQAATAFKGDRVGELMPLWREELSQLPSKTDRPDHDKKLRSRQYRSRVSAARTASLCALEQCLRHCKHEDWFERAVSVLLGASAARIIPILSEYPKDKFLLVEVLHLLRCAQVLPPEDTSFQACYYLAFVVVRVARTAIRLSGELIDSTVNSVGESLPQVLDVDVTRSPCQASRTVFHLLYDELEEPSEPELLGEAVEALSALLSKDVEAAQTFLISLAEAPSLGPFVDAATSLAIVRRLSITNIANLSNAGRVTASVQVLLRRAMGSVRREEAIKDIECSQASRPWHGWRLRGETSVDLVTVIALAYQGLGEKAGQVLVSGLVDRARDLVASDNISTWEDARAAMAVTGSLLNTVATQQMELGTKVISIMQDALSDKKPELRLAAALSLSRNSPAVAEASESLITFLAEALAQGGMAPDPFVVLEGSMPVLSLSGSPTAVTAVAIGTKNVLSACREKRMVVPESTMTTSFELLCECLLWNKEVAPRARCVALEGLDLLWEALVEQEAMADGKNTNISISRFFPRDLPFRVSMGAIMDSLLAHGEQHAKAKSAAAGAVVTLVMGAGAEAVLEAQEDLPQVLFEAVDEGCEGAFAALQTLVSDTGPQRIQSWIETCEHMYEAGCSEKEAASNESTSETDELLDGIPPIGCRTRVAAIGVLRTLCEASNGNADRTKELSKTAPELSALALSACKSTDIYGQIAVSGTRLVTSLCAALVVSGETSAAESVLVPYISLFAEALRTLLNPAQPPEVVCAGHVAVSRLVVLTSRLPSLLDPDLIQEVGILRPDSLLRKFVMTGWSETTQGGIVLSVLNSFASLVCSVAMVEDRAMNLLREEMESSLRLHRHVFLAICADMSALLCEGPEVLSPEGGSVTLAGIPPHLLESMFQTHVADVIFASVLLQDSGLGASSENDGQQDVIDWMNPNAPGACLIRAGRRSMDLEIFLLSLMGWWLASGYQNESGTSTREVKERLDLCCLALKKAVVEWQELDWGVVSEAITNLAKLNVLKGLDICWSLMQCGRLKNVEDTALDICGKCLLSAALAESRDRDGSLRRAMEVIFSLLVDGQSHALPQTLSRLEDLSIIPVETVDEANLTIETSTQGAILDLVRRVAENELYSRTTWRGFQAIVETVTQVVREKLENVQAENLELMVIACATVAEAGFERGNAAGFACVQPVLKMANDILSTTRPALCAKLLDCPPFTSLLLRTVEVPTQEASTELVELLSHVSKCAVQGDESSEFAIDLLLMSYLQCATQDASHQQRQQVFASVLVPILLERLRSQKVGTGAADKAAYSLGKISEEYIREFGGDLSREEAAQFLDGEAEKNAAS